jgi:hypothetical protein
MPAGIGRPYNKDERLIAGAKKRLRAAPKNKSIKDAEGGNTRGGIMGLTDPSNDSGVLARTLGEGFDRDAAKSIDERSKYAK